MQRAAAQQRLDLCWEIARQGCVFGALRTFGRLPGEREDLPRSSEIRRESDARVPYRDPAFLLRESIEWRFAGTRRNVAESVATPARGIDLEAKI